MSRTNPRSHGSEQPDSGESSLDAGQKVHDDTKTRQAQANGNSENCLQVNLTRFGKDYHGIEKGQLLEVEVREEAILIKPYEIAKES
ncbi:hypothetical protein J2753_001734 [Halolamina salifodinae]|uniref:Uncharacterized protein n=1 Tax=Halolamina salifodinae TaxID=1202767 RepID=A0A8T4GWE8_9EURY|nr:hypothetical protein [Halolamina salifodinae]